MGAISLIPLLMSVALLSRTALDMTKEGNSQRKEERPASYRSHNVVSAWGKKILQEAPESETDFSDHQVIDSGVVVRLCSYDLHISTAR